MSSSESDLPKKWQGLKAMTPARVALGRVGHAPPLDEVLKFQLAHSEARDAVWHTLDWDALARTLEGPVLRVKSRVVDRAQFLLRPDGGRRLHPESRRTLEGHGQKGFDVSLILADGLSAAALEGHGAEMFSRLKRALEEKGLSVAPAVLAQQARVALGDEVGEVLEAKTVLMLIGERPGLSAADSLSLYLTHGPRVGCLDSQRNCVSNIHSSGLSYAEAVKTVSGLLEGARVLGRSGVDLKPLEDHGKLEP